MQGRRNLKKTRGKAPGRKTTSLGGANRLQPPPFIPTISLSHKFRFTNGANIGNFNITRGNLLNLLLVTPTAITSVRLLEAVRLKMVEVWGNPVALGSPPALTSVEWIGENSPSTIVSDRGMGVRPAHVRTTPPSDSSNRWWSISGTSESDILFVLSIQANSVVDITLELRFVETESPTAGDIPAGAVIGQLYGDYLDGLASGKLAPEGYTALP